MNKVILTGRLVSDDFKEYIYKENKLLLKFVMAIKDPFEKEINFVQVTIFNSLAKKFKKFIKTGDLIEVEGKLKINKFKKDDNTIVKLGIIGEEIIFSSKASKNKSINTESKECKDKEEINKLSFDNLDWDDDNEKK